MQDEDTGAEPRVISASICDPYLLLIRDDSSVFVAEMNSDLELDEVIKTDSKLVSTKWLTGCLYVDTAGVFAETQTEKGKTAGDSIFMFLLSATGSLHVSLDEGNAEEYGILIILRSILFQTCQNHRSTSPRAYVTFLRY